MTDHSTEGPVTPIVDAEAASRVSLQAAGMARPSAQVFVASAAAVLIALATTTLVSRSLGPSGKGTYDLAITTAALLALVLGLSLPSGITFVVAQGRAAPRRAAAFVVATGAAQLAATVLALALFAVAAGGTFLPDGGRSLVPITVLSAVMSIAAGLRAVVTGRQRVVLASWLDVGGRVVTLALIAGVAVAATHADAVTLLTATTIGGLVGVVLYVPGCVQGAPRRGAMPIRSTLSFALPSHAANVLQFLTYRVDFYILGLISGVSEVGIYALGVTLAQLVWLAPNAVAAVLFPRVSAARESRLAAAERTATMSRAALMIGIVVSLSLALSVPWLLPVIFGEEFADASIVLWILLPGAALFGPVAVMAAHLAGIGRPGLNARVASIELVIMVALDLLLIPPLGSSGAALASSVAYSSAAVVIAILFNRETGTAIRSVLWPSVADARRLRSALALRL